MSNELRFRFDVSFEGDDILWATREATLTAQAERIKSLLHNNGFPNVVVTAIAYRELPGGEWVR